ncbi:MAG: ABC transporter ATP-binding protein [Eubacteriaceae bacterium]
MNLSLKNVTKCFGSLEVLKGISLSVESGKALGLLGRNGAGKTTTLRILMDVFPPDQGEILLDGKPINRSKIKIGYMPEERGLYPKIKILEQLIYFANLKGMPSREAKQSANYLLEQLEMEDYKNKRLDTLSKGNQQKIQLVATLICDPDIVILDEPFSGLDPVNATLLKDLVRDLLKKNKIVLFSSHQMNYVEEFCEHIAILNKGTIVCEGQIKAIKGRYPQNKIVINSSEAKEIKLFADSKLKDFVVESDCFHDNLLIQLKSPENKKTLFSALSQNAFDINSFKVYEPSLNEIFVEYTEASI